MIYDKWNVKLKTYLFPVIQSFLSSFTNGEKNYFLDQYEIDRMNATFTYNDSF